MATLNMDHADGPIGRPCGSAAQDTEDSTTTPIELGFQVSHVSAKRPFPQVIPVPVRCRLLADALTHSICSIDLQQHCEEEALIQSFIK
jgi:hypothetical protein